MRLSKLLFPIILIAVALSCQSMFNNDNGIDLNIQTTQAKEQTTTFNGDTLVFIPIGSKEPPLRDYPTFLSEVKNQQIIIKGYYLASSGFIPVGSFTQKDQTITILIKRPEDDKVSPSIPTGYFYDAFISNLEKGEYIVEIFHKDDDLRGPGERIVFDKKFIIN